MNFRETSRRLHQLPRPRKGRSPSNKARRNQTERLAQRFAVAVFHISQEHEKVRLALRKKRADERNENILEKRGWPRLSLVKMATTKQLQGYLVALTPRNEQELQRWDDITSALIRKEEEHDEATAEV
jgi:trehalose-6-phosphate synthase